MPTFAELLTEYMARTGIGDAELARRIQVSRLTLIRWREGVTSRPRYRDDVVRCAEVLRLTPEESDGLLLAAGFAPDDAPAGVEIVAPDEAPAAGPAQRAARPLYQRRAVRIAAVALLAVAAVIGASFAIGIQGRTPDHPVAVAGESLIVMAPFANYTAGQQGFNIQGRLKNEIDREVAAAGLSGVRTVEWPEVIAGEPEAVDAGVRSRASMVIWGEYDSGRVVATFTVPPLRRDADRLSGSSYSPQVVDIASSPGELPTAINLALTDEVSSMALMTLGQLYLEQDEHDLAKTALAQALTRKSIDTGTLASLRFRLGRAYLGGKYVDLDEAVWLFTQVLAVEPRSVDTLNNRALAYLGRGRDGDAALAVDDLTLALRFDPRRAGTYLNRAVAYLESSEGLRGAPANNYRASLAAALDDLDRAIDIDPDYASAYVNRANAYLQRDEGGDLDRAFDDLEEALDIEPALAAAYVNRGNAYLQRDEDGDLERADLEFTRAIEISPNSAAAFYNRGLVRSALLSPSSGPEDWTRSTGDLQRAQELEPRNFAFNNALCWQLGAQSMAEQALSFCEIALWERPQSPALDSRGLVHAVMGNTAEAIADFEAFLAWVGESQKAACGPHYQPTRQDWLAELKSGGNPFDAETLRGLRLRPVAPSVGEPC